MFITLSIIILILFNAIILISLQKVFFSKKNAKSEVKISSGQVGISIVIAAKNEEKNIKSFIKNFNSVNYSHDKYEVILVDDHSVDNTLNEINESIPDNEIFKVISLEEKGKNGKREALTKGFSETKFENILITDADCKPEREWLNAYSNKFSKDFDFVFGIAPFRQYNTIVNKISCFENLRSSILTFSFAGLGLPYSAAARNFGFTKSAFESVGGYSKTKQTLSGDDDLLLREAIKRKLNIGTLTKKGSFVYSDTMETLKEYLNQRARHTQTSAHYLIKHKVILAFWHLTNLFALFSVMLMIFNPLWGILFATKLIADVVVVKLFDKKFGYHFNLFGAIFLQITYELFLILHFINSKMLKIEWKQN